MPFSAPTTVVSQANDGYLAIFQIGSPLAAIAEIKSFSADVISMPEVENTHLLSPNNTEEFVPGMIKPGKLSFSGNLLGDATQLTINTLSKAQTTFPFAIVAPVQRKTKTYTGSGNGFITSYKIGPFEKNKPVEFAAEIQITGTYTEAVA